MLGLDISSSSVKLVQLSHLGNQKRLDAFGMAALPDNVVEGTTIKDMDGVAETIKRLVNSIHLTTKKVAVAVPDANAISKIIQVNEGLNESEIEELVLMEADKYIPYPIDEVNLDFNILGISPKHPEMQDVLIVASRSENVNNKIELVKKAGLEVVVIDVESFAIERAITSTSMIKDSSKDNTVVAVFDLGAFYTHLYVLHGLKIAYSRDEEFGGKQLLDAIMQQYGFKIEEAKAALSNASFPPDYENRVLKPFNEMIVIQMKRMLQFFFSTTQYNAIDHMILAGGVAKQPGLAALLQEQVGVQVIQANPFANLIISNKDIDTNTLASQAPLYLVAYGLALRTLR